MKSVKLQTMTTLEKIIERRDDLSKWLFHFTKKSNARETLEKIISDRALESDTEIICFTEAPITVYKEVFKIFQEYKDPLYAPYGVAIPKKTIYLNGGRPVIYSTKEEGDLLPNELKWRFVEYDIENSDYTWQREWRLNSPRFEINPQNCFLIVRSLEDEFLMAFDDEPQFSPGEWDDGNNSGSIYFDRLWKAISIEGLEQFEQKNRKINIEKIIREQEIDK